MRMIMMMVVIMMIMMVMMMMMMMVMVVMTKSNLINNKWLVRARYAVGADISESWGTVSVGNIALGVLLTIISTVSVGNIIRRMIRMFIMVIIMI